ncbi:hypothetical protein PROFUN_16837, partial [Planoprotostelium fungivorum]
STNMKPSNRPQPTSRHVWNPSDLEVIKTAVMKKRKPKQIQQQFFPNVGLATVQNCVARIKKQMEREKDEDEKYGGLDSGEDSEEENPSSDRIGDLIRGALGQPSAKPQSASSNSSINITSVPSTPPRSHHAPAPCALPPPAHVPTPSIQTTTIEGFPEHGDTHNIPVISWSWPDGMFYTLIKRSTGIAVDAFVGSDGIHVIYSWTPTEDEISQLAFDLKCHTSYLPNIVNTWKVEKVITPPVEIGNSVDIVSDIESFIVFRVPLRAANRI